MSEFMLTTVLHFNDDSREGQIFCVGTKEACAELQNLIPAIAYSGDKQVLSAGTMIIPLDEIKTRMAVGECWRTSNDK